MAKYERCAHCGGWINTDSNNHVVHHLHNGTDVYTHYMTQGGCGLWYEREHGGDIKSADVYRKSRKTFNC